MNSKSIGFIGGGRIVRIFLDGFARGSAMPKTVVVHDSDRVAAEKLKARYPAVVTAGLSEAASQNIVFLAVHPPVIPEVVVQNRLGLRPDTIMVSLAPKFTIAKLTEMLGGFNRIARMIPNAPSIVGKGFNPTTFGGALSEPERKNLQSLFACLGECVEVPEEHLEIYAVVSAMGLTFLWPQLDLLVSLAESGGLSRKIAWDGIEKMLLGGVAAMRDSGLTSAEVQDLVPVKPLKEEVGEFIDSGRPKLEGLLAKLRP